MSAYSTVTLTRSVAIDLIMEKVGNHPMAALIALGLTLASDELLGDLCDQHLSDTEGWTLINFLVSDYPEH